MVQLRVLFHGNPASQLGMPMSADKYIALVEQMPAAQAGWTLLGRHQRQVHLAIRHLRFQLRRIEMAQGNPYARCSFS